MDVPKIPLQAMLPVDCIRPRGVEHKVHRPHRFVHTMGNRQARLCDLAEAWEMSSTRPAGAIRLATRAGLSPGAPADVVLFERRAGRTVIHETWKGGRKVHERS